MRKDSNDLYSLNPSKFGVPAKCTPAFEEIWREGFNSICHQSSIWQNSFFSVLSDEDSQAEIRSQLASIWSLNMLLGSYSFPRYVSALAARSEVDVVRHGLLENAWDEAGAHNRIGRSHFWLAVRLAECIGFDPSAVDRLPALPSSQSYITEHLQAASSGTFENALGMICLIEEFTTPEFSRIAAGLISAVNELNPDTMSEFILSGGGEYFTANIADDERHREEMPKIVAAHLSSLNIDLNNIQSLRTGLKPIFDGARKSIQLRQEFLDEIYSAVENGMTAQSFWNSSLCSFGKS